MVEYFIKHFGTKLEGFKVDFVNKSLWHGCMPWLYQKTINKNLNLESLKFLEFRWRDDHSLLLLKVVAKKSKMIENIKLILPDRDLVANELKIISNLETKANVQKVIMRDE